MTIDVSQLSGSAPSLKLPGATKPSPPATPATQTAATGGGDAPASRAAEHTTGGLVNRTDQSSSTKTATTGAGAAAAPNTQFDSETAAFNAQAAQMKGGTAVLSGMPGSDTLAAQLLQHG